MPEQDKSESRLSALAEAALDLHASGRPGKLETRLSKSLATARDLSLAYSPGVAAPCLEIAKDPELAYSYTTRGNMVAVISNGTAVLGLGNIGALASKPVMEGKVALFKRFADVDGIDLEVSTEDVEEFINCVRLLGPSFGGINLEDIKAPECFVIETRLRELMDIPVFHDDQHGTAIVAAAALINACHLTKRDLADVKLVVNGAGAAGIACIDLLLTLGMRRENIIACDTKGVIHRDRHDLNQWKSAHAVETGLRTLEEAVKGSDVFLGLSAKGALTQEMVRSMAPRPIILALANPDPEITPEEARAASPDAIIATGRSDYPNQVNNVLGFPYIFRGALDVRARTINEAMKAAAAQALAELAREDVPDEVHRAAARQLRFGPDYIIPNAFDPRLITRVPLAVAEAAVASGVARRPLPEVKRYRRELAARLDTAVNILDLITEGVRDQPKRIVFAEGENETMVRAAAQYHKDGFGTPILIGNEDRVRAAFKRLELPLHDGIEIRNARLAALDDHKKNERYSEFLYGRLQRRGYLLRDVQRMVNQDRNVFAACAVAMGDADGMVTGLTRAPAQALEAIRLAIDPKPGRIPFGLSMVVSAHQTLLVADTLINMKPSSVELAMIARASANRMRALGQSPRVAFCASSTFGQPQDGAGSRVAEAVRILESEGADFEFDGEMTPEVALDARLRAGYPFARLTDNANVLVMPGLDAAQIATQMVARLGEARVIGPVLTGLAHAVQVVPMDAKVSDLVIFACLAAAHTTGPTAE
ncbi:NADP-dependent malic enzyme [Acidisoma cellulosilytica]|uniref:NADP-dependent malic enzyme n=1 Tax=Acidisoma cellulosilyticum TaxID=2802395 RepID=A0A963Z4T4_9PROT|nr:NADP-dependent malic enzyme [Acidisoma cellulosilyticum]MCB8882763.1 NADP-dependent malic enzyme [Acidisoma cellulosilyticum]